MTEAPVEGSVVKRRDPATNIIPLVPQGQLADFSIERDAVEETIEQDWTDYLSEEGARHLYDDGPDEAPLLREERALYGRTVAALGLAAIMLLTALFTGNELAQADAHRQTRLALLAERTALKSQPTPTPAPAAQITNTSAWFQTQRED